MSANAGGTPTTNFSIPKFNTASDPPNGKGTNEMMDALDSLLAQRIATLTTTGDMLYASAANTPARLPIGGANTGLISSGGIPTWAASLQSLMAGTGDLVISTGANTPARLAAGVTSSLLQVVGGLPAWVSALGAYVPTWTSGGTAPALGNGTLVGNFIQIAKMTFGVASLNWGTTTTNGTGAYFISTPTSIAGAGGTPCGLFTYFDASAGQTYSGFAHNNASNNAAFVMPQGSASVDGVFASGVPQVGATGDSLTVLWTYINA